MKIVFMGTPDFAVPSLRKLIEVPGFQVVGVITQPDRPKGRGNKITPPPVKTAAAEAGVEVFQPQTVNSEEAYLKLKEWDPEVIVVVAFGQILKSKVLEFPPLGCINVHGSLLPKYRGAAPIHWAVIRGEKTTGITTMFMDTGLDTGDIILQEELAIGPLETTGELHDRLAVLGAEVLLSTLRLFGSRSVPRQKQDESEATYAPSLTKEDELIDWSRNAVDIVNHIRGMNPWPVTYTRLRGKILKIWRAQASASNEKKEKGVPGEVLNAGEQGIIVQAGSGQVAVSELQLQNRPKMSAEDFLRGNRIVGEVLGDNHGDKNEG